VLASSPGSAQAPPAGSRPNACSLLSNAELLELTGRRVREPPDDTPLGGGSACTFGGGEAQIVLFSGEGSAARLDGLLRGFGQGDEARHPVPEIGGGAYVIYPVPKNRYQDRAALLVATVGRHAAAISMNAEGAEPAEALLPRLVTLSRAVLAKLR
jgi:hypothetical protein